MQGGNIEEARAIYEEVLARAPDFQPATLAYGQLCVTLGDLDTARSVFRRAWEQWRSIGALVGLGLCEKLPPDSPEALEIGRLLQRNDLSMSEYVELHQNAAGIADRAGDYEGAFHHFAEAKRLAPGSFDLDAHRTFYRALKELFSPAFFAERQGYGHPSARPVFIVGMPRSGTTLTEQIISSHPDSAGAGELTALPKLRRPFIAQGFRGYGKWIRGLTRADVRKVAEDYLKILDGVSADALRVTDKMPHNYENLGLIALLFPNARIVHCTRDPRDTCVSCFTTPLNLHLHRYTNDLTTLGGYYREYVDLMDHWREVLPIPIYESNYEELVGSLEEKAHGLIDFIGLPWDPACLAFHESKRAVFTASKAQVRQPLYSSSVARWRRYEKHLGPLVTALGDLVEA